MNEQELQKELEKTLEPVHAAQVELTKITLDAIGKAMQLGVRFGMRGQVQAHIDAVDGIK